MSETINKIVIITHPLYVDESQPTTDYEVRAYCRELKGIVEQVRKEKNTAVLISNSGTRGDEQVKKILAVLPKRNRYYTTKDYAIAQKHVQGFTIYSFPRYKDRFFNPIGKEAEWLRKRLGKEVEVQFFGDYASNCAVTDAWELVQFVRQHAKITKIVPLGGRSQSFMFGPKQGIVARGLHEIGRADKEKGWLIGLEEKDWKENIGEMEGVMAPQRPLSYAPVDVKRRWRAMQRAKSRKI